MVIDEAAQGRAFHPQGKEMDIPIGIGVGIGVGIGAITNRTINVCTYIPSSVPSLRYIITPWSSRHVTCRGTLNSTHARSTGPSN